MLALVWEHENMAAQARTASAWSTDEGVALQMRGMGASPTTTRVASALYNEVPL
jgi:thiamine pyrophosphate-dependent acetolactate synthase large subunit-like protein